MKAHTHESITAVADHLEAKAAELGPTAAAFKQLETRLGFTYSPEGLLWDRQMREIARVPECVYWDWMHNMVASGGYAQLQINELCRNIIANGFSLVQLDAFAATVKTGLRGNFFRARYRPKVGAHFKAFASEMLCVVTLMKAFADSILKKSWLIEKAFGVPRFVAHDP